jgi:hypothetical protein
MDPQIADRLATLCGMFGSHYVGERAAAALKGDKLVRERGLTWRDLIRRDNDSPNEESAPWSDPLKVAEQSERDLLLKCGRHLCLSI